jgi:hypothetical protein
MNALRRFWHGKNKPPIPLLPQKLVSTIIVLTFFGEGA